MKIKTTTIVITTVTLLILSACSGATPQSGIESSEKAIHPNNLINEFQSDLAQLQHASIYTLDIKINPEDEILRVIGSEEVLYTNQEPVELDVIYFRLFPNVGGDYLAVSDVKVDGNPVDTFTEFGGTALRLELDDPLPPGNSIAISLQFNAVVPSEMGGNYGLYVFLDEILALDAFFPIIPVYNDEGWNVEQPPPNADMIFADAAFFSVTVDAPEDFVIAAGGKEIAKEVESGRQIVSYIGGPQRDFYLAASPNFVSASVSMHDVEVTSYFLEEYREAGERVLEIGLDALESFSNRLGVYPYTELDLVSTPMQAGGMEYSNITALGVYFYDPDSTTTNGTPGSVFLEAAAAHEVAHQWFYCQVMNDQIDEPWLDESLVQYITYLYYLDTYGNSGGEGFMDSLAGRWGRVEHDPIPIGMQAAEYSPVEYGAIVYGRGALFFDALAGEMGQDVFDTFLRTYVETLRWKIAEPLDMLRIAEETCGCELADFFNEWGAF